MLVRILAEIRPICASDAHNLSLRIDRPGTRQVQV